jgi:hypothetical protein
MASLSMSISASATASAAALNHTPAQGALDSAGAGITGGMLHEFITRIPTNSSKQAILATPSASRSLSRFFWVFHYTMPSSLLS